MNLDGWVIAGVLVGFVFALFGSSSVSVREDDSPKGRGMAVFWILAGIVIGGTIAFAGCSYAFRGL